ncbi:3-methyladenine DNA glycosylase [Corynebacterium urealyticum]|uniref:3-methyladenine DNA glycosylase n=1 Tax=Corynebacterium urealyticum TaxID=43771 RepID=UPI0011E79572|nr:3-methyladenine DNA glycosylase [Corynebacterium urealyticum]TYR16169.1 3-methyladenine DNA glycosylase [Corynebacterium urealyticum]
MATQTQLSPARSPEHVLGRNEWEAREAAHVRRVESLTTAHQARRQRGERHPVWDFLFSYYPVTPGKLKKWHPGLGTALQIRPDEPVEELPQVKDFYQRVGNTWRLDLSAFLARRGETARFIQRLLAATAARPAVLSCFGLHEWAMVYRDTPRHPEPLRLGAAGTNEVVESHELKCTHFDAFRFFTPASTPMNTNQLSRESQEFFEQPSCLHAGMDLYKWATKLGPVVPGELWVDCFELARDFRQLDMEASPYDLREWGFEPVRIETAEGKAEYVRRQRELTGRAQELRGKLLELLDLLLSHEDHPRQGGQDAPGT